MEITITSKVGQSSNMNNLLYGFLSNFVNYKNIIPPQLQGSMDCTQDSCIIDVQGQQLVLKIVEKEPCKLIKIGAENVKKDFFLWIQLKEMGAYDTRIRITMRAKMNLLQSAIAKKQLQQFVDTLVDGICSLPGAVLAQTVALD